MGPERSEFLRFLLKFDPWRDHVPRLPMSTVILVLDLGVILVAVAGPAVTWCGPLCERS